MLSQAAGYAATALGYIETMGGKPVLVRDVAHACHIPAPYLSKIIHTLGRHGIVNTQRGVGGGVVLAQPASEISLLRLCQALGDHVLEPRCMLGTAECSEERACPAHVFWCAQRARIVEFLESTFVSDIAAFQSRDEPG